MLLKMSLFTLFIHLTDAFIQSELQIWTATYVIHPKETAICLRFCVQTLTQRSALAHSYLILTFMTD